ncbi:proteasome subunit alpha type-3-like [Drosophila guanche]|uniref:Blast:Proteasome subunit alpha type-3 n=1 Tax=Drosophila guanche TaxID=7266 RepID=A0A3B0JEI0_DROGU|nr:proteasome subunit alpha type-3-like [Drosophila guanche]SPP79063.1 blast:Proteasome subunit alpha type-3 [Drosophila guanche]
MSETYSKGAGFDLCASQYAPNGRLLQLEYAARAADNSGTVIGICGKDSVLLAVENLNINKLFEKDANQRIFNIDGNMGMAVGGLLGDCSILVDRARLEAASYRQKYERGITLELLCERVDSFLHAYTLYSAVRPFALSIMMASWDNKNGPRLYKIEPSGTTTGHFCCSFGKGSEQARSEMEKFEFKDLPTDQLVKAAAEIIHGVHDERADKNFRLDVGIVGSQTKGKFEYRLIQQ